MFMTFHFLSLCIQLFWQIRDELFNNLKSPKKTKERERSTSSLMRLDKDLLLYVYSIYIVVILLSPGAACDLFHFFPVCMF